MYGVVDCDCFYASCERIFRPDLAQRPVAVLSNNDGCVIALTGDLKRAGFHIGIPFFQCRDELRRLNAAVFSANFTLYGDISMRVMSCLREQLGNIVVYSIDEAFFSLLPTDRAPLEVGLSVRGSIMSCVGVPVTIGIAPTYTLSKAALKIAKRGIVDGSGVHQITSEAEREFALHQLKLTDVWGLGSRFPARLDMPHVKTAWDFAQLPAQPLRARLDLPHWSTYRELNGRPCVSLAPPPRRLTLLHSRTFPRRVADLSRLTFIVRKFAARAAERLREHALAAQVVELKLGPISGRSRLPLVKSSQPLAQPSADTFVLMEAATKLARALHRPGQAYVRACVVLHKLSDCRQDDLDLAGNSKRRARQHQLLAGVDQLNSRFGRETVSFGSGGWRQRQLLLSPCYTTRVSDICQVS